MSTQARPLQTGTYFSRSLKRDQKFAYFIPPDASAEAPVPLLVLLHGWEGAYLHWPTYTRVARYAMRYQMAIAFPDGGNGWYTNAFDGSANYEDDLILDFLPHLQNTLPLLPPGKNWAIGGLSMGGYGAVKIALKHSHLFSLAISHSGGFHKPQQQQLHPIFGDPQAQASMRKGESVYSLAELALCRFPVVRPRLMLDCGLEDEALIVNRPFKDHLTFIGYQHEYREMPGYHTWPYWDRALKTALPEIAKHINARPSESQK